MRIRIEADELPGRTCAPAGAVGPDGAAMTYRNIHVAVQGRGRDELLEPQPADAVSAGWQLECATKDRSGAVDVTGPQIQGRPGERFIYLSWGTVEEPGGFTMFRRAKLMLDAIPTETLAAAARRGLLVGWLGLTDRCGDPVCARVVPPAISWTAGLG